MIVTPSHGERCSSTTRTPRRGLLPAARGRAGARVATTLSAVLLCSTSCSQGPDCVEHPVARSCPDLRIGARAYDEWRPLKRPPVLQEIDDASYPACNHADQCGGDPLKGLGATDVWRLDGVSPARAVIALREGTSTYVIFVRRGTDPRTLRLLIDPRLLRNAG